MQYLGWFLMGLFLSTMNVLSITRMVDGLHNNFSKHKLWLSYTFRYIFTGVGLFLALQQGVSQVLIVFVGIVVLRWTLLIPKFRRLFLI